MAPTATSGGGSLPSGFSVLATFPDLLFIFEFVFAYVATLIYVIHAVFSLLRWKSS
ncbi:myelin and lymphocyte protein isoform X1 [Trichosurus vulpecula]|uniref:myelin and lymphocyte protein isoform X1 n=1 Tax=Trichosurus vulpecula TaxID=9337 RepID=UPI00186ACB5D|nr:myelin and lymphocyte protein isoform X1 [Trichosurus vulpecula]